MKIIRKLNIGIAILGIGMAVYHFFIEKIEWPAYILFSFLAVMSLLGGVEKLRDRQEKGGYIYIAFALVLTAGITMKMVG
ncbi:hypothetical protein GCM10008986_31730 [Salinibacillus aidingensis]|uniref:DUF3953 domain-containing protein n=1 Tax=Salinibacillus aidingensis TaxID=237684 RepID=A0ABP3LPB7_9BACI